MKFTGKSQEAAQAAVSLAEPDEEDTVVILRGSKEKCHRVSACFCN